MANISEKNNPGFMGGGAPSTWGNNQTTFHSSERWKSLSKDDNFDNTGKKSFSYLEKRNQKSRKFVKGVYTANKSFSNWVVQSQVLYGLNQEINLETVFSALHAYSRVPNTRWGTLINFRKIFPPPYLTWSPFYKFWRNLQIYHTTQKSCIFQGLVLFSYHFLLTN